MKHIIYICNTRFPTEKAHGLSTVKICEAFAEQGCRVDLVVPRFWKKNPDDLFSYYGVKRNFSIHTVPCLDLLHFKFIPSLEWLTFFIQIFSFSLLSLFYIPKMFSTKMRNEAVFFSHDYMPLYAASLVGKNIFYDIHHFPGKNPLYKRIMKKSFAFAVQTKWKAGELERVWHVPQQRIVYWPNGTDVSFFKKSIQREDARHALGLSLEKKVVVYTGQLFGWKGVDTLVRSVATLDMDTMVYIVGGSEHDVVRLRHSLPEASDHRIHFVSFRPHKEMLQWLKAADVLVLPNTGKQKVSLYYTSPMKLFEYMASGIPIVASRIPSISEILNADNAVLVTPDEPEALAQGIDSLLNDEVFAQKIAARASKDVDHYTWDVRAKKIIDHIHETIPHN